jgi:hypothetical protein
MTAVEPLSCGATKLVPPNCAKPPGAKISGSKTACLVCGSAFVETSGVARPVEVNPERNGGFSVNVKAVGSVSPGAMVWG